MNERTGKNKWGGKETSEGKNCRPNELERMHEVGKEPTKEQTENKPIESCDEPRNLLTTNHRMNN